MELSPDTKRTIRRARVTAGYGALVVICVIGAFSAGWGLREYTLRQVVSEEVSRMAVAQQAVVTELYNRIDDRDVQLREQSVTLQGLTTSFKQLAEKTETTVDKVDKAVAKGDAARLACVPLPVAPTNATIIQMQSHIAIITALYIKCATTR